MKTKPLVLRYLAASALIALVSTVTAQGASTKSDLKTNRTRSITVASPVRVVERVVYVRVTGSLIPQRVVLVGNNVNGASNMFVLQSHDLLRSGSATVEGMLLLDPSISFSRGGRR